MGLYTKPSSLSLVFLSWLIFTTTLVKFVHAKTDSGITKLVYKGCADQKFPDASGDVYIQNLKTLLSTLVSQSSQKNFATTTSGDGQTAIIGLYQCRGDLTTPQCNTCVSKIQDLAYKLCSKAVAARVQLSGCYLTYEIMGFSQVPGTELLYKFCGSTQVSGAGFEQRRDMAFDMVTNGVKNSGELFYTGSYEQVYVLGQCEGDLASGDCGDCVKAATEKAKNECGDSISVQVYLHKCFISYSYYPNGVPCFPFTGALQSKSRSSPLLSFGLVVLGAFLLIGFACRGSGIFGGDKAAVSRVEGDFSCTSEVQRAIPILKKAYGDSMRKVLHVGPDTCSVVSTLLKEEETEAWGVEPYDIEDADAQCKSLVQKGIVRVADIKFPLPYRAKSFPLVIVSDALDYLSPKYLNKTLPDLARVASDGIIIFAGYPGQQRAKVAELSKFGRPAKMRSSSWWIRYFVQTSLEENEPAIKMFEQAASKKSYKPNCQVFHLKPLR